MATLYMIVNDDDNNNNVRDSINAVDRSAASDNAPYSRPFDTSSNMPCSRLDTHPLWQYLRTAGTLSNGLG